MKFTSALPKCLAFLALTATASAFQGTTTRESVATGGAQGNGASEFNTISSGGRFVAFHSAASTLVAGDTNASLDVFVRDLQLGTTERVSLTSAGGQGNNSSGAPWISGDARFVAFNSVASNLVAGDTNGVEDVFVRDRQLATTTRVSVATGGTQGNALSYFSPISADGHFIAFISSASNLVAGDTNGVTDTFIHNLQTGTTERVSVATGGAQGNNASDYLFVSADGRFVAFRSLASNLVPGDTNGSRDIFVRDLQNGTTKRVSVDSGGAQANGASGVYPWISGDGRFVAFPSGATNLVLGDANGTVDCFMHDRQLGTTELVSVSTSGTQSDGFSDGPSMSADGRFVAFHSLGTNLVVGDTNGVSDVFLRDRLNGTTERVSVDSGGTQANNTSQWPVVSSTGRFIVLESIASNLVTGDTNTFRDVFVHDRGPLPPTAYCTSGTTTNGCSASIASSANPSVSLASACTITVANVEGLKSGILFYGTDNSSFAPAPWGTGSTSWLCVKPPTQRTTLQTSGGTLNVCDGSFVLDWNAYQIANPLALGNPWTAGDTVYAQAWFRDPPAVKSTNLSDAIEMTYVP